MSNNLKNLSLVRPGGNEEMSIEEYLELCKVDKTVYASPAERMLRAIGEPVLVDTKKDPRLSRIFQNKLLRTYPAFAEFYGMEAVVEHIVSFFRHSAQGLEEKKQVLYFLGPVGGGKSSLAEQCKKLMEKLPIYRLGYKDVASGKMRWSPVFESPLGIFPPESDIGKVLRKDYGIPLRYLTGLASPWAVKRLDEELDSDWTRFFVQRMYPSVLRQRGICKVEPGDENNQDVSTLVGKVNIRQIEDYDQNDPDAYSFSGGLCLSNQGLLEFVEMFKAPIKVLHPLLTATQEGNYKGTEGLGAIPFQGIVLAHSNESEWKAFRGDKNNEAFLDRVYIAKVPYTLRVTEECAIYKKYISLSDLSDKPCAPHTLEMMAQWSVLTRLKKPENSNLYSKMLVYDGENLKDIDPNAKTAQEYRDSAGQDEGMTGSSTRFAFKTLSDVFNVDPSGEIAANPVHLLYVLQKHIEAEDYPEQQKKDYLGFIKEYLQPKYFEFLEKEIQAACIDSYEEYGQNIYERYYLHADHWVKNEDYRDQNTGETYDKRSLNSELEKIEKPAGISNPKDFRQEIVNYGLRYMATHNAKLPNWRDYQKIADVIEKKIVGNIEQLLPVISFNTKPTEEQAKQHDSYVNRMKEKGYTLKQIHLLSEWYLRTKKAS